MATGRKKSPRAPSISLDDALERAMRAYDKVRLLPAPTDAMAQHIGYKTANNGAALQALASLRYYGLFDRPQEGQLAVSKDVESYRLAPDPKIGRALLGRFLRAPALFAELLDKYEAGLPSEGHLKDELIQRGFLPTTAAMVATVFRRSVEFANYGSAPSAAEIVAEGAIPGPNLRDEDSTERDRGIVVASQPAAFPLLVDDGEFDRIPVRLPGARRAWLVIPSVFYESDKQRLKAQIDLLLTEEDEASQE